MANKNLESIEFGEIRAVKACTLGIVRDYLMHSNVKYDVDPYPPILGIPPGIHERFAHIIANIILGNSSTVFVLKFELMKLWLTCDELPCPNI
jgi:hypothetical protein